jgi:hypothetical protein
MVESVTHRRPTSLEQICPDVVPPTVEPPGMTWLSSRA